MRNISPKFLVSIVASLFVFALTANPTISMAGGPSAKPSIQKIAPSIPKVEPVVQKYSGSVSDDHSDDDSEECGEEDSDHNSSPSINSKLNKNSKLRLPIATKKSVLPKYSIESREDGDDSEDGDEEGNCSSGTGLLVPETLLPPTVDACSVNANLSWVAVTSAGYATVDSYEVQYSLDSGTNWTSAGTTALTSFVVTGLTANQNYLFRVAAHNSNGWGAWSTVSSTCSTTPATASDLSFYLDGLINVPTSFAYPTVTLDYVNQDGRQGLTAISYDPASDPKLIQGIYLYDLYVGLPAGYAFTFNVVGGTLVNTWADATTVPALGHPINTPEPDLSHNAFLFTDPLNPITIYAFSLNSGSSSLSISINPL